MSLNDRPMSVVYPCPCLRADVLSNRRHQHSRPNWTAKSNRLRHNNCCIVGVVLESVVVVVVFVRFVKHFGVAWVAWVAFVSFVKHVGVVKHVAPGSRELSPSLRLPPAWSKLEQRQWGAL